MQDLARWSRRPCAGGVVLVAPDGDGRVRIRPRLRPLVRLRTLLDDAIAESFAAVESLEVALEHDLVTEEGEKAVVAGARFVAAGEEHECLVAVAGDDPFLCIDTLGSVGRYHDTILASIRGLGLGLGTTRRRWYRYAPPPGWLGLRRARATVWLHPRYPRVAARVTVFDARPFSASAAERLDRFLSLHMGGDFSVESEGPAEDIASEHGLPGRIRTQRGAGGVVRIAGTVTDEQYLYAATFEGPEADGGDFRAMLVSFQALPRCVAAGEPGTLWSD